MNAAVDDGRYIPPPPPPHHPGPPTQPHPLRTPVSAGSDYSPLRRGPVSPPSLLTATLPGFTPVHSQAPASPYSFRSPVVANSHTPISPHGQPARGSPLSPGTEQSPMAYRSTSGSTMMEYNPQQWGRGGPTGGIYRPHATLTVSAAPRQLDDSGQPLESPPPPYTPNDIPNVNHGLDARVSPHLQRLQTNVRTPSSLANEVATPTSAITVISPLSTRGRGESPMNFPPPPPNSTRDRSGSRPRFGLSALTRGRSTDRSITAPVNAIENLQYGTREALANAPVQRWDRSMQGNNAGNRQTMYMAAPPEVPPLPPAARRSASTGTMSHHHWAPNMALPPPPGPPPATAGSSRSASMSRAGSSFDTAITIPPADDSVSAVPIILAPTRRPPHRGTQLGPVPPTPAGYSEFPQSPMPPGMRGPSPRQEEPPVPMPTGAPAVTDTSDAASTSSNQPDRSRASGSSGSWSGSLRREQSAKGIRERRSESRAAKDRIAESAAQSSSSQPGPADLVLSPLSSGGRIGRSGAMKKTRASPIDAGVSGMSGMRVSPKPSKTLPAPPPQQSDSAKDFLSPQSTAGVKSPPAQPVLLPDSARIIPGSATTIPRSATRSGSHNSTTQPEAAGDSFAISSIKRHQDFVRNESSCKTDLERLQLFAEYVVAESRVRRDQYSTAFASMEAADVMDLTRNLWRTMQPTPTAVPWPASTEPSSASSMPRPTRTDSMGSFMSLSSPMSGSQANFTPLTEPESPASIASSTGNPRDCGPWARHKPVLSPIPSMAMSTVPDPDEDDSRGRPASRWWESSAGSTGASQRIERTKRESKFMGVSRDALATLQWQEEPSPSLHGSTPHTVGDYPIEKTGWHDDAGQGSSVTPRYIPSSMPPTPDPHKLDVSRLVTLPPPYPRHYPAMSNNHPDLASIRVVLDSLRELDEITMTKEAYRSRISERRDRKAREATERRSYMRHNIQEQLSLGQMSYAQAAAAEQDFNAAEARTAHTVVRQEYDAYQPDVMTPLHALVSEKITKSNACITQLCAGLRTSADSPSPNEPQEEGDEQPELLEKLNLLKWLVEAREALHKALDELEGERNELYREVIVKPLRDAGDEAKVHGAQQFFNQDIQERKTNFEKAVSKRYEEFAKIIEKNVTRGVEDQLSAFWDIAPGLSSVVQKVPDDLSPVRGDFDVQIPSSEFEENPQYERHPCQYLYTLLTHAEKSAYQFIESQTNLMCLLHEAHTGLMVAGIRLMEQQRFAEGENWDVVHAEMSDVRKAEEQRLTMELKEKVETIESQWREGLGSSLEAAKERVRDYLYETGGWDDSLLE